MSMLPICNLQVGSNQSIYISFKYAIECFESVKAWLIQNKLKLNDSKTAIIPCLKSADINTLDINHVTIGYSTIIFSNKSKTLMCVS